MGAHGVLVAGWFQSLHGGPVERKLPQSPGPVSVAVDREAIPAWIRPWPVGVAPVVVVEGGELAGSERDGAGLATVFGDVKGIESGSVEGPCRAVEEVAVVERLGLRAAVGPDEPDAEAPVRDEGDGRAVGAECRPLIPPPAFGDLPKVGAVGGHGEQVPVARGWRTRWGLLAHG